MTYTQPDLSEVLSNEQTLNSNLIALRSILRNKLSELGISYEDSDSINVLVSKMKGEYYWELNKNSSTRIFDENIIIENSNLCAWGQDSRGKYLQSISSKSGSNPALTLGLFSDTNGNVLGSSDFKMRFLISKSEFINGGFSGVGLTLGTPTAESAFYGVYFGAYQNSSGEVYPAIMNFKNTTSPTISLPPYRNQITNDSFHFYLWNNYAVKNIQCHWYDNIGNMMGFSSVSYNAFCESNNDMANTIRFGVCNGAEAIGRLEYIPRLIMKNGCRIQL